MDRSTFPWQSWTNPINRIVQAMNPIYIFRHVAGEGPGYFGEFLNRHLIPSRLIAIDQGTSVPISISDMGGLVFMGGPMSVNDPLPWIDTELNLIRQAQDADLPVLGHCLGGQLIAKALGATVKSNDIKEIGWHEVQQNVKTSPRLAEIPASFEAFHWHGETFDLPDGAIHIFESHWCKNQAFIHGRMLALQFHVEMTEYMVKEWANLNRKELATPSASIQSFDAMTTNLEIRTKMLHSVADIIYGRWLSAATEDVPFL